MSLTTKQITESLKTRFAATKFSGCTRRNRRPAPGWTVPGNAKWTKAVKAAGVPWDHFWSGIDPTPSTQYPQDVADYIRSIDNN
jgi:hypothetical protein